MLEPSLLLQSLSTILQIMMLEPSLLIEGSSIIIYYYQLMLEPSLLLEGSSIHHATAIIRIWCSSLHYYCKAWAQSYKLWFSSLHYLLKAQASSSIII